MAPIRYVVAALLLILGVVWIGQGLGFIGGSFMSSQPFWAAIGLVLVVLAGVLVWRGRSAAGSA